MRNARTEYFTSGVPSITDIARTAELASRARLGHSARNARENLDLTRKNTSVFTDALACLETSVGFFEHASRSLAVGTMLKKGQGVPFAALGAKKISPVDVDGTGQTIDRVQNRMNDVGAQELGVPLAQCFGSYRLDIIWDFTNTSPENVVLSA